MAFCIHCGTPLNEGSVFCHECGTRNSSSLPSDQVIASRQVPPVQPEPVYVAPPPPVIGSIAFTIEQKEFLKMVHVEMQNSAFRYESGGMYYMRGYLEIESNLPSAGGLLKSMVTKEHAVKPVIRGTGSVNLEPSFGEFTILELNAEEWILDKGAYFASEMGIEISMFTNKSISGLFSGEGFFQTRISGTGKVVICSNGPLEEINLSNEKLVVDGPIAVARTAGINLAVSKATKGIFSSMTSGEGIVNTFTGSGKILIAPVANRYITLTNYLSAINRNIMSIKNKG